MLEKNDIKKSVDIDCNGNEVFFDQLSDLKTQLMLEDENLNKVPSNSSKLCIELKKSPIKERKVFKVLSENFEDSPTVESIPVVEYYRGRSVLITGATGFMGKVLVFKLLKHCPDIKRIYLLIRPKREVQPHDRLKELLECQIFHGMTSSTLDKVSLIEGDITLQDLGISKEDEKKLINSVSVVFHCAATVRFDDDLTKSVEMNIVGTQRVVTLARKLNHLSAFVHTSTAYSHCYLDKIEEKFYKTGSSLQNILNLCNHAKGHPAFQEALNHPSVTKVLIGQHPNTYTFTKALAEEFLSDSAADLPMAIVRPSIVIASWKDPMPGWIDNINGPTGVIAGAAGGVLRAVNLPEDNVADLIPVDVAINLMCVVASRVGSKSCLEHGSDSTIPIFHVTSGDLNPITWRELRHCIEPAVIKFPLMCTLWYPSLMYTNNVWIHWIYFLLLHKLPALVLDFFIRVFGFKPFLMRVVNRMERTMNALDFFVQREWKWEMSGMDHLENGLTPKEREIFPMNLRDLNWPDFVESYVYGFRTFVVKEGPESLNMAKIKSNFQFVLQHLLIGSWIGGFISILSFLDPFSLTSSHLFNWINGLVCAVIILFRG